MCDGALMSMAVKAAMAQTKTHVGTADLTIEAWIRIALWPLSETRALVTGTRTFGGRRAGPQASRAPQRVHHFRNSHYRPKPSAPTACQEDEPSRDERRRTSPRSSRARSVTQARSSSLLSIRRRRAGPEPSRAPHSASVRHARSSSLLHSAAVTLARGARCSRFAGGARGPSPRARRIACITSGTSHYRPNLKRGHGMTRGRAIPRRAANITSLISRLFTGVKTVSLLSIRRRRAEKGPAALARAASGIRQNG